MATPQGKKFVRLPGVALNSVRAKNGGPGYPMKLDILASYRKNRLIHERVDDPYKTNSKPPEPTVCPFARPSSRKAAGNGKSS
jgi:hypothetical protein